MSAGSIGKLPKWVLGRYQLEKEIGADLLGRLWAARTRSGAGAGSPVTIRCIAERTFGHAALDDLAEAAFWAMGLLEGNALTAVQDVVRDSDELGVGFRHLEGNTLRALLQAAAGNGCPIPEAVVVRIVIDTARQLTFLS